MQYNGGKFYIAKEIAAIIQSFITDKTVRYLEPFVGASNVIQYIKHPRRVGTDLDPYIITLFQQLQKGWIPPTSLGFDEYKLLQDKKDKNDPLTAFAGYGCSFGGKFFGGYTEEDCFHSHYPPKAAGSSLVKQLPLVADVRYHCLDYARWSDVRGYVIYCDPPYIRTTRVGSGGAFNHDRFNIWCRHMAKENTVLVSEYQAPFKLIWEKSLFCTAGKLNADNTKQKKVERLYLVEPHTQGYLF